MAVSYAQGVSREGVARSGGGTSQEKQRGGAVLRGDISL